MTTTSVSVPWPRSSSVADAIGERLPSRQTVPRPLGITTGRPNHFNFDSRAPHTRRNRFGPSSCKLDRRPSCF